MELWRIGMSDPLPGDVERHTNAGQRLPKLVADMGEKGLLCEKELRVAAGHGVEGACELTDFVTTHDPRALVERAGCDRARGPRHLLDRAYDAIREDNRDDDEHNRDENGEQVGFGLRPPVERRRYVVGDDYVEPGTITVGHRKHPGTGGEGSWRVPVYVRDRHILAARRL